MSETIYVSQGYKRLKGGTITALDGSDISSDAIQVAIGDNWQRPPLTGWVAPTLDQVVSASKRKVMLLIDNTVTAGKWVVWAHLTDSPEIEPVVLTDYFTTI